LELRPVRNGRGKRCRSDRVISLPTANGGIARAAYARAVKAGLNVNALLKNASLSLAQVSRPEVRIPVRSQVKFLDEVAAKLNDNFLGIRLARSIDLRELGLVYYVLASSEDLRGALTRLARYSGIHNEGIHIGLGTGADMTVSFEYVGVMRTSDRHQIEFFVATLVRLCRQLTGRQLSPSAVRLMHRRTKLAPDLAIFFGCPVEFGASMDQVTFPPAANGAALTHADPYLNELLRESCDALLSTRRVKAGDWRTKVENVIVPLLPHGEATIENVAPRMGVSCRTLARRLAREHVNFLDVLQDVRLRLAKQYLSEPDMSISQAAWLLGYSGPSAFSHAFNRWTGRSPRQMRSG
jgi:AraC-like DNA-binding protein